jgi:hypothetical protein
VRVGHLGLGVNSFFLEVGDADWIEARLPIGKAEESPRAFWQARFHDFNVYSLRKKKEKLNYMHANPVKRGLVKDAKDWPWSSWSFYRGGEAGLIRIDVEK